jgi:hypothetical protein
MGEPIEVILKEEKDLLELKKGALILNSEESFIVSLNVSRKKEAGSSSFEIIMCGNDLNVMKISVAEEIYKHTIKNNLPLGCYNVSATIEKGEKWYDSEEFTAEVSQSECRITY